jgi:hypothetical protein
MSANGTRTNRICAFAGDHLDAPSSTGSPTTAATATAAFGGASGGLTGTLTGRLRGRGGAVAGLSLTVEVLKP